MFIFFRAPLQRGAAYSDYHKKNNKVGQSADMFYTGGNCCFLKHKKHPKRELIQ